MVTNFKSILERYNNNKNRLMDILIDIQFELGYIPEEAIHTIAGQLDISKVDVKQVISFYHFFTEKPGGKYTVYLNNSVVADMKGRAAIAAAFEQECGIKFGEVSSDGLIGLFYTADMGMNDQEPAALINGIPFTNLNAAKVRELVSAFKSGKEAQSLVSTYGDGSNAHELVRSMVKNNIMKKGPVLFEDYETGSGLKKALQMGPDAIIQEVKNSNIRGRGGAGFPTGLKWDFCRKSQGDVTYLLCNADEGEPGTFKERVILTELPHLLFEGMAIAGYTLNAREGILYLRAEYNYLKAYLEDKLQEMRNRNMLGKDIGGQKGFDFDIRIQMGAGAYVCGEESALMESCEGKRGEPRNKPPFPVQVGYMDKPTVINNVETLSSVVKIVLNGGEWFKKLGTNETTGTKLLSISGDIEKAGVYEIEWGMSIREMLEMVGATNVQAVQVGGPSGTLLNPAQFDRKIAYEDLATGGSMIVIGNQRDLIRDVVLNFMEFFIDESCGSCAPCRSLTPLLINKVDKIINGKGNRKDINELYEWGRIMKDANRCGLGQTAANPVLTSIENFRSEYEKYIKTEEDYVSEFDMNTAVQASCEVVGRVPNIHE
jgi:[NiFe] hydrogenase diaphorase moiety large subunit